MIPHCNTTAYTEAGQTADTGNLVLAHSLPSHGGLLSVATRVVCKNVASCFAHCIPKGGAAQVKDHFVPTAMSENAKQAQV